MVDERELETFYKEGLEVDIISWIAEESGIDLDAAMEIYYGSRLADKIHEGRYGIQYLSYKVLVAMLHETEPELFV